MLYQTLIGYLSSQASNPAGLTGRVITKIWSDYFRALSKWTLQLIDLKAYHTILDLGPGGGANINYILAHHRRCIVYGIDQSPEAIKTTAAHNQTYIDSQQLILATGDAADLPCPEAFFDLIIATQTHIYWNRLKQGLSECYRTLKKDGLLVLSCETDKIAWHLPAFQHPADFVSLLLDVGFSNVEVFHKSIINGRKAGSSYDTHYIGFVCKK